SSASPRTTPSWFFSSQSSAACIRRASPVGTLLRLYSTPRPGAGKPAPGVIPSGATCPPPGDALMAPLALPAVLVLLAAPPDPAAEAVRAVLTRQVEAWNK